MLFLSDVLPAVELDFEQHDKSAPSVEAWPFPDSEATHTMPPDVEESSMCPLNHRMAQSRSPKSNTSPPSDHADVRSMPGTIRRCRDTCPT